MSHQNIITFTPVYIGLGSNLGNKRANIERAIIYIEKQIGKIVSLSAFYDSEPSGFESDNLFVNRVVEISTSLSPIELLIKTQSIERKIGRTNKTDSKGYSDRIIDIDILFFNKLIIDNAPLLVIPHPLVQVRDFVLMPLSQIAPNFIHPVLNKTILQLLDNL